MSFLRTLFSLVHTSETTSRSVTHPQITKGQARLTLEFFVDEFPEKKLQLIDMGILSILLSPGLGCHTVVCMLINYLISFNLCVVSSVVKVSGYY